MKKLIVMSIALVSSASLMPAFATNGDNLIGIGPVGRAMGGVGIAAPQDSITAIFSNPAAMSACPCGVKSESIFGATLFDPTVNAKMSMMTPMGMQTFEGKSQHQPFVIPAVGVTMPIGENLRLGVGAYGVSGMGVDYRGVPGLNDMYTKLEIMKFAPMLGYQVTDELSVGVALQGAYNNLDLGMGGSHDYSFGAQLGVLYNAGIVSVGASYTTPAKATHENVMDMNQDGIREDMDLEAPATYGVGVAVQPNEDLVLACDVKQLGWSDADGYKDFGWDDQVTVAVGAQYQASEKLALRCGYNFGESPVEPANGFNPMDPQQMGGEFFKIIGFPAIVEDHMTLGAGYAIAEDVIVNVSYMHAFENTVTSTSAMDAVTLESSLEEDSYSFAISWAF